MSSRREEKERRREERLARERDLDQAAARRRRLQQLGGGALAVVAVAAIAVAATSGGGASSGGGKATDAKAVVAAASAAGCKARSYPNFGRNHTTATVQYKTNPPTSGDHAPEPASDGIYDPGGTPRVGKLVHAMEHGRVEVQYGRQLTAAQRSELVALINQRGPKGRPGGHSTLLFENTTGMPYVVAASSWQHLIGCRQFTPKALQALRAFRDAYVDKGPELIPTPE